MPSVKQPNNSGNSFLDIASRMRTPRLVRPLQVKDATNAPVQPSKGSALEDMAELRERLLATRASEIIIDEQEAELEGRKAETTARRAEAKLMTAEAEAKLEELRDKRNGGSNETMAMLIALLQQNMAPKQDDRLADVMMQIASAMGDLRNEVLNRLTTKEEPKESFTDRVTEMVNLKAALDSLFPQEKPAPVAAAASSVQEALMLTRLEYDHKMRMLELEEKRNERAERQQAEIAKAERESKRSEQLGGMFAKAIENVGPVVKEVLAGVNKSPTMIPTPPIPDFTNYPPVTAMPVMPDSTPSNVRPFVPNGGFDQNGAYPTSIPVHNEHPKLEEPCPHCHSLISYPVGETEFKCPRCGNGISVEYTDEELAEMAQGIN